MSNLAIPARLQRGFYLLDLIHELVSRDMKLRYKRTTLGIIWSLLNPLALLLVLNFVFRAVLPLNIPNYTTFLFAGLLAWFWFQNSLYAATTVIIDNRDLIRQPGFPTPVLPVVIVTTHLIHYILALPILLVFLLLEGGSLTGALVMLPLVIVVQFGLTLSVAYLLAAIHVTFRDTQYLLGILLFLGFYLTPVFYDVGSIPANYQLLYHLNPMVTIIEAERAILLRGELPNGSALLTVGVVTCGLLWLGYTVFTGASQQFVDEL